MAHARDTVDYITLGLASWGAVVSTGLAARQMLLDRPRLTCHSEFEIRKVSNDPISHAYYCRARVANRGQRGVHVDEVGWFDDKTQRWTWMSAKPFFEATWPPGEVQPGATLIVDINRRIDDRPDFSRLGIKAGGRTYRFPVDTRPGHEDRVS
jgi:hypothetical protein